jgi:hypothetical protein
LARWFHRLRWLRRVVFIGGVVTGVAKALQGRSGGGSAGGLGGAGRGPGGSGRPAPTGGPDRPRLAASTTPPSDVDNGLTSSSAPSSVRTLVSVPPLVDDDDDGSDAAVVATAEAAEIVATSPTGAVDFGEDADGDTDDADDRDGGSTAPVLTIVSDVGSETPAAGGSWLAPLEGGECPPGHPIKAKEKSGIYHVPGGRSYDRTAPERCYTTAEAAEADGYRPAKA